MPHVVSFFVSYVRFYTFSEVCLVGYNKRVLLFIVGILLFKKNVEKSLRIFSPHIHVHVATQRFHLG